MKSYVWRKNTWKKCLRKGFKICYDREKNESKKNKHFQKFSSQYLKDNTIHTHTEKTNKSLLSIMTHLQSRIGQHAKLISL